jgi:hypothetical protein
VDASLPRERSALLERDGRPVEAVPCRASSGVTDDAAKYSTYNDTASSARPCSPTVEGYDRLVPPTDTVGRLSRAPRLGRQVRGGPTVVIRGCVCYRVTA